MHEAEDDVVHRLPFRDGDRDGEEGDAALGVERAVDRVDDDERQPRTPHAADLLRDDGACGLPHAGEDDLLGSFVDRRRLVAALARADDRLALHPRRQALEHGVHIRDGRPAEFQPVSQFPAPAPAKPPPSLLGGSVETTPPSSGSSKRPEVSLG